MLVRTGMLVAGSGGAGFVPTIETFTLAFPTKDSGCAPIAMTGAWVLNNPDNTSYKLVMLETGTEFNCATSFGTTVYTSESYVDGAGSVQPSLTLQVVRRSDDVVMSSANATCSSSIAVGDLC